MQNKADVNALDSKGRVACHIALHKGYWEIVKYLASVQGADLEIAENESNSTPLKLMQAQFNSAVASGSLPDVKKYYLPCLDANAPECLHHAATTGNTPIVQFLVTSGDANVDLIEFASKASPLILAAQHGQVGTVSSLIELKANVKK